MINGRQKITAAQRQELLQHYLEHGSVASAAMCIEFGVSPKYASSLAASMGCARPLWRKGNRYKDNHTDKRSPRSLNDPRWARARAVGAVIA